MVPLSAETGGRLQADFTAYVKSVIVAGLVVGGTAATEWTPATRVEFIFPLPLCASGHQPRHRAQRLNRSHPRVVGPRALRVRGAWPSRRRLTRRLGATPPALRD